MSNIANIVATYQQELRDKDKKIQELEGNLAELELKLANFLTACENCADHISGGLGPQGFHKTQE